MKKRIIVGISGATGTIYGIRLLEELAKNDNVETHLIITKAGKLNIEIETDYEIDEVENLADYVHDINDISATISSGSFKTEGIVVIPCSIKTLSGIANSFNTNLLIRTTDVQIKERRKVIICTRETPLHEGHLELMLKISRRGGIILPPVPAFYIKPKTIDDIINHIVGKILDIFEIKHNLYKRWDGEKSDNQG